MTPAVKLSAVVTDLPRVRIALALILGLLAFPAAASADDETRIIVARDPGLSAAERADIRSDAGVALAERLPLANTEVVTTDADRAKLALRRLNADPDVRYAELDRPVHAFAADPRLGELWALYQPSDADMDVIGPDLTLPDAWTTGQRGAGHTVAVIDTGVYAEHPDLIAEPPGTVSRIAQGLDFVGEDAVARDPNGHGTHVTGTIAATADNGAGIAGVAPLARILPLRVLRQDGGGTTSDVVAAYALAASLRVPVVNLSFGSPVYSQAEHDAIAAAGDTLFVVAAGNHTATQNPLGVPEYPCRYGLPNLLCVGASTAADQPADFSDSSPTLVDVFAPGAHILSTWNDGGYGFLDGTSMAAPQVSGIAALLLGKNPELTAAGIKAAVEDVDLSPAFAGKAAHEGRVSARRALGAVPDPPACTTDCGDPDHDGVVAAADLCPHEWSATTADGCIAVTDGTGDGDGDGKIDRFDACPAVPGRPSDGCPDRDGDGLADRSDACPDQPSPLAGGCPPPPVVAPAPPDRDGDGRADSLDACPAERAATRDGCPVPVARSVVVKIVKWSRRVTLRVRSTRAATASFALERRVCDRRGRKCRWKRVATRRTSTDANVASFTKRLARGRYRGTVTLSSPAGTAAPARRSFTVR
jgi:hypothetical protein